MNVIALDGCRTEPVGSYLQGLGVWRSVVRLLDPDARAHWTSAGLVLTTSYDLDGLVDALADRFEPLPIVSPWNSGSGFAGNGKSASAERNLAAVRTSTDPRLARLRAAVQAADRVVANGRELGWSGSGEEMWKIASKPDVVMLCRNTLPDDALPWVDTAVVLGQDSRGELSPAFSRLLGTGGNFGRQDLSATYVQQSLTLLSDPKLAKRSAVWLRAALTGDESVPYERGTVGQFDPGRAGGIQSSPLEKSDDKGFVNPWSLLLGIEGTVLFASAAVRREGSLTGGVAIPFLVRSSPVGFASAAGVENVSAELWMPVWRRPATFAEIEHLLSEGRAEWNGKPARTGLDFVRAVASLGIDRGITSFTRHVIAERLGQNPLAVPVGRFPVPEEVGPAGLLAEIDAWLAQVRGAPLPGALESLVRRVDTAIFEVARLAEPESLRQVVIALGRLHEAVSRSSAARSRIRPLTIPNAVAWWRALEPDTAELRLAGALASAVDGVHGPGAPFVPGVLRTHLTPVEPAADGRRLRWSGRPAPVSWGGGTTAALAATHRRRAVPGVVNDPYGADGSSARPAVKGVLSAYARGFEARLQDMVDLATDAVDDELLGDYLRGLLLFDWSSTWAAGVPARTATHVLLPPLLAQLVPFFQVRRLRVRLEDCERPVDVVLRPGPRWLAQLAGSDRTQVWEDAARRLRAAGIPPVSLTPVHDLQGLEPNGLTASLLLRLSERDRLTCLSAASAFSPHTTRKQGDVQ